MADKKITQLTSYTPPIATDILPIVDITTTETKKISVADLLSYIIANLPSYALVADTPTISSGIVVPISTPTKVGDLYVDTVAQTLYFAVGNSSSADWILS